MEENQKCKKGDSDCTFGKDGRTKEYTPSDLFHDVEITGLLELSDMEDLRNDYKMLCKQGEKQYTDQEYQELPWEKFHGLALESEPPIDSRFKKKYPERKLPFTAKYIYVRLPKRKTCVTRKKQEKFKPPKVPTFVDMKPEFVIKAERRKLKLRKKRQVRKGCKGDSSCPTGMICYCKKPYRGMCTKNQGFCVYKYDLADKTVGFSYEPSNVMSKTKKYKKGDPCSSDLECKDSGFRRCGNSDIEYDGQSYTLKPKGTKKDSQCLGTRESLKEIRILRRTKKNVDENKECITRDNCKPGLRCRKIQDEEGGYNVHRRVCKK